MNSQFDGVVVPDAVGVVRGLRCFAVSERLTTLSGNGGGYRFVGPMKRHYVYQPGENHAECTELPSCSIESAVINGRVTLRALMGYESALTQAVRDEFEHMVGGKGWRCGFYAYYNGRNAHLNSTNVAAVIEGYGTVTYGSDGFRARKCQIVAAVNPHLTTRVRKITYAEFLEERLRPKTWRGRAARWASRHPKWPLIGTVVGYAATIAAALLWSIWALCPGIPLVVAGIVLHNSGNFWFEEDRHRQAMAELDWRGLQSETRVYRVGGEDLPPEIYARLAVAYPEIRWYGSTAEMLEDFPLTKWEDLPQEVQREHARKY